MTTGPCLHCGEARSGLARRYCSVQCRDRHRLGPEVQTLHCTACDQDWSRVRVLGTPSRCPRCASVGRRNGLFKKFGKSVLERDGWKCQLCFKSIHRECRMPQYGAPSVDHVIPVTAGGKDTIDNLRAAHFGCNRLRGAGTFTRHMIPDESALLPTKASDPLLERDLSVIEAVQKSELSYPEIAAQFGFQNRSSIADVLRRRGVYEDARARRWRIARGTQIAA